MVCCS